MATWEEGVIIAAGVLALYVVTNLWGGVTECPLSALPWLSGAC